MRLTEPALDSSAMRSRRADASGPTVMRPFKSSKMIPSRSDCWMSRLMAGSDGHFETDRGFHFFDGHHFDSVPRAAVEEGAIGTLADALLAADAEHWVDFDMAERRMVLIRHPVHAVGDGAIGYAGGRAGAAGTAFGDDR